MCDTLKSPGCQTAQRAAAAEERIKRLEAVLAQRIDWEWLETEISAIDTMYRGSPSYTRDAYWFKDEVLALIQKAAEIDRAALQEDPRDAR